MGFVFIYWLFSVRKVLLRLPFYRWENWGMGSLAELRSGGRGHWGGNRLYGTRRPNSSLACAVLLLLKEPQAVSDRLMLSAAVLCVPDSQVSVPCAVPAATPASHTLPLAPVRGRHQLWATWTQIPSLWLTHLVSLPSMVALKMGGGGLRTPCWRGRNWVQGSS